MNLFPGDKLHSSHKTQSSSSSCSFPLFLPPSMSSIWRGCRGWRALQSPWQTWASEAGTCQSYFYCRCPWGFTKLFRTLCLSSLSFSLLLISETSMTSNLMHLRKLHVHCFCMTLLYIHIHESVHVHAAIISWFFLLHHYSPTFWDVRKKSAGLSLKFMSKAHKFTY